MEKINIEIELKNEDSKNKTEKYISYAKLLKKHENKVPGNGRKDGN